VCSVILFCLPISVLGGVLGVKALREVRIRPAVRGRGLAMAAIVIALLNIGLWSAGAVWWHANFRRPMLHGPIEAIRAGQAGDVASFRAGFILDSVPSDEACAGFLNDLTARYGRLLAMRQVDDGRAPPDRYQLGSYRIPYQMEFETGPIMAEGLFVISTPQEGLVARFAWLAVRDPARGDMVFPASAAPEAAALPPDPAHDDGS